MPYADHTFEASATITAAAETIWPLLVDVAAWPEWDSGVLAARGTADRVGAKLSVTSSAAPDRAFPVTVAEIDAPRRLVLVGGAPFGLFRGVRTYTLTPAGATTLFRMHEIYSGPLLRAIWKSIPDLDPSFRQFADGLKARAEARG